MSDDVDIAYADGVLTITWNAPDRLNGLTAEMLDAAADAVESVPDDARLIVVTGTGRAFSSGAAITEDFEGASTLDAINRLVRALTRAPVPVVAGVNGLAAGAAVSIALAADLVVARRSAYFLLAFVNIALAPDGGASELVAASVGRTRANQLAMLGERLPAAEAEHVGLIHRCADDDAYETDLDALVDRLAHGPTRALGAMKQVITAATLPLLDATLKAERERQVALFDTADFAEGTAAFREKRSAAFEGR